MWTIVALVEFMLAVIGGVKYGLSPDTMLISAAIFSIAAAIEIAAMNSKKN